MVYEWVSEEDFPFLGTRIFPMRGPLVRTLFSNTHHFGRCPFPDAMVGPVQSRETRTLNSSEPVSPPPSRPSTISFQSQMPLSFDPRCSFSGYEFSFSPSIKNFPKEYYCSFFSSSPRAMIIVSLTPLSPPPSPCPNPGAVDSLSFA